MKGFWQVSDPVPAETIKAVTSSCERTDCRLSAKVLFTTCAAISSSYNKEGILEVTDHNDRTTEVVCSKCWKCWEVKQSRGSAKFTEIDVHKE